MAKVKKLKLKENEETTIKLDAGDMAVLQDFQLTVNHLTAAMGRFLGHVGVQKYGLTEGEAYGFDPNWKDGTINVRLAPKKPQEKPPVKLEK